MKFTTDLPLEADAEATPSTKAPDGRRMSTLFEWDRVGRSAYSCRKFVDVIEVVVRTEFGQFLLYKPAESTAPAIVDLKGGWFLVHKTTDTNNVKFVSRRPEFLESLSKDHLVWMRRCVFAPEGWIEPQTTVDFAREWCKEKVLAFVRLFSPKTWLPCVKTHFAVITIVFLIAIVGYLLVYIELLECLVTFNIPGEVIAPGAIRHFFW